MNKNPHSATTLYQEMCLASEPGSTIYRKLQPLRVNIDNKQERHNQNTPMTNMEGEAGELQKTCLIDEWMGKKRFSTLRLDNNLQFFCSSSSSSHSSSPDFSSSDCEYVQPRRNRDSCFPPAKQKQIRARTVHSPISKQDQIHSYCAVSPLPEMPSKSKSTALKMYADLKNSKLPISPGGRLTKFINSMFNGIRREIKAASVSGSGVASKSQMPYTCSSASSSTRSCLVKKSHSLSDKTVKKSVRFYPTSIEYSVDIRSRNVEHSPNSIYTRKDENLRFSSTGDYRRASESVVDEDDKDDTASDTSSELFEIDHIVFAGISNGSRKNEHPVFETTSVNGRNRAISNADIVF